VNTPTVLLGDVADINPHHGGQIPPDEKVSFLGMADVSESGETTAGAEKRYSEVRVGYTQFWNSDLLVAKITPCFQNGKIAQAKLEHELGAGSTEFHVVRGKSGQAHQRYLLHFLRQQRIRQEGELRMTGSGGQRRVPQQYLAKLAVPLPSFGNQKRIAAVLDQVDALRAKRREAIALLDDLAQSIFLDMFKDLLAVSGGSHRAALQEVTNISSGITKGRKSPAGQLVEVPYLAVANVQDRALDLSSVKKIQVSTGEIERYRLQANDLLLTEGGDPDKLGRGMLWREELPLCLHQNHIFRVRISDSDLLDPVYLNWLVASEYGKRYFLRTAKQTTGVASINKTQLGAFPVPLPPVKQQQLFSRRLELVQQQKDVHLTHLAALDQLFTSLQQRAFNGTLWQDQAA
jgi:type I restriction enzyme, S subunit